MSEMELRPNQIVTHNTDLENAMNTALSEKWGALRGLKVVSIALGSVTLPDEDAELIKQAQRTAIMRDPTMAAATLVGAQVDAMKTAAGNEAGAMTGFMGMGMAEGSSIFLFPQVTPSFFLFVPCRLSDIPQQIMFRQEHCFLPQALPGY